MKMIAATDIETIPDIPLARALNDELESSSDSEVLEWIRENKARNEFPKHIFHQVVSQSIATWTRSSGFDVLRLGEMTELGRDESTVISDFGLFLEDHNGAKDVKLVTFNGSGFDLPVLVQRAMRYGSSLKYFWDQGQHNRDVKWDNYVNRYQSAHTDLMDVLSLYNSGARMSLNELGVHCGFPGKIGIGGSDVYQNFIEEKYDSLDDYCDVDVVLTFLCYINYMKTAGFDKDFAHSIYDDVNEYLFNGDHGNSLLTEFGHLWNWR